MLYELAYPMLCLTEVLRRVRRRPTLRHGPAFEFRAVKCRMRRREIALATNVAPTFGGWLALRRFERARPEIKTPRAAQHTSAMLGTLVQQSFGDVQGNAPRVLLIHGWNSDSASMRPLADALAQKGLHVTLPDLPGEGANRQSVLSFEAKAKQLAQFYGDQAPFDAIIGHSAGGLIAGLALEHGLPADRLITVCAPVSMATLLRAYLFRIQAPERLNAAILKVYGKRHRRPAADIGPNAYARMGDRLMVAHSKTDWQVRIEEAHQICALNPTATQLVLTDCNHHTVLTRPVLHDAIVRFIAPNVVEDQVAC